MVKSYDDPGLSFSISWPSPRWRQAGRPPPPLKFRFMGWRSIALWIPKPWAPASTTRGLQAPRNPAPPSRKPLVGLGYNRYSSCSDRLPRVSSVLPGPGSSYGQRNRPAVLKPGKLDVSSIGISSEPFWDGQFCLFQIELIWPVQVILLVEF